MKTNENEAKIPLPRGSTGLPTARCSVLELALSVQLANPTFIAVHASASYPHVDAQTEIHPVRINRGSDRLRDRGVRVRLRAAHEIVLVLVIPARG
jgi:hypothetical protein